MKTLVKSMSAIIVMLFFINNFASAQDTTSNKTAVIKIKTSAICGSCKTRIEKNIAFEKGVTDVALDLETKIVTVTYRPSKTNPDKIRTAISKIGYDADNVKADPAAYKKLPACCKKDGMK